MTKVKKLLGSLLLLIAIIISFSIVSPSKNGADTLSLSQYTDRLLSLYGKYSVDYNDYSNSIGYNEVSRVNGKYMASAQLLSSRLGIDVEFDNDTVSNAVIMKLSNSGRYAADEMIASNDDFAVRDGGRYVSLDVLSESLGYEINYGSENINIVRPYLLKRLLVKTDKEFNHMGAVEVIEGYNDLVVLQFATEEETRLAHLSYKQNPDIEYIDIDFVMEAQGMVDSTATAGGPYVYQSWGGEAMGVGTYTKSLEEGLAAEEKELEENIVVVLDSGVDSDHIWFEGRIAQGGKNFLDIDYDTLEITVTDNYKDDNGHGTHVSGTIVDLTQSNVKILPLKVLNKEGKGPTIGIAAAMQYALQLVEDGMKISALNMSLGGTHSVGDDTWNSYNEVVVKLREYNVPTVVAAGNDSKDVVNHSPGNISSAITVAAIGKDDNGSYYRADFSNYGTYIDVAAPGVEIISAWPGGYLAKSDGTSMAAPHVTAAVALLYSDPDTAYTCAEIEMIFKSNAIDLGNTGWDIYYGDGLVSLEYAYAMILDSNVVFSRTSTACEESFVLTLSIAESSAKIYYTLDGTMPSLTNGKLYDGSITISTTTIVRAIAFVLDENGEIEKYSRVSSITYTFGNQDVIGSYVVDENGVLLEYNGIRKELDVPSVVNNLTVVAIGEGAFTDTTVERVSLPDSVILIDKKAFAACPTITVVEAPGVTEIGDEAFAECIKFNSLTNENFPVLEKIGNSAFENCYAISKVELPVVKKIGAYAFSMTSTGTSKMTSIDLPALTSLGVFAFYNCENLHTAGLDVLETVPYCAFMFADLETLELPNAVRIANYAFYHNINLAAAIMPKVEYIGMSAFNYNVSDSTATAANLIASLDLPKVKSIGVLAFSESKSLTSLIAPHLMLVGRSAFADCTALQTVSVDMLTIIGEYAFKNTTALTAIDLPVAIEIRAASFYGSGLQRVSLCSAVEHIGKYAFRVSNTNNLLVQIPLGSTVAENYVAENGLEFTYLSSDYSYLVFQTINSSTVTITDLSTAVAIPSEVVIPEYLGDFHLPVTTIGEEAFKGCDNVKKVISKTLKQVNESAFAYCEYLTYVSLENVEYISKSAFYLCKNLSYLDIPNVSSIEMRAFYGCDSLRSITLSDKINYLGFESVGYKTTGVVSASFVIYYTGSEMPTIISNYAAENYTVCRTKYQELSSLHYAYEKWDNGTTEEIEIVGINPNITGHVILPSTVEGLPVTSIGEYAFEGCSFITGVELPSTVRYIRRSAFEGCTALEEINLDDVEEIELVAFRFCTSLKEVNMPKVEQIPNYAFYGCVNLEKVAMDNVTYVGVSGFEFCENLQVVKCPKLETVTTYSFYGNTRLHTIDTGAMKHIGVESFNQAAFMGCYSLKEVVLPNIVTIAPNAFNSSGVEKLFIGKKFEPFETSAYSMDTGIDIYGYKNSTAETFATSNGNTFYPIDEVAFTKNLTSQVKCLEGATVTLSVTAVGFNLSYQWYLTNSSGTTRSAINGANGSYWSKKVQGIGTWYYFVEVTDWTGVVIRSNTCKLVSVSQFANYTISVDAGEFYKANIGYSVGFDGTPLVVEEGTVYSSGIPIEFLASTGYSINTIYLVGESSSEHNQAFEKMADGHYCGLTSFTILAGIPINQNYKLYATTVPRNTTKYDVYHYKEVLEASTDTVEKDGLYFKLDQIEPKTGTTATTTNAQANAYDGYSALQFSQKTILADGSQVIYIYYVRNFYSVTLESGTGVASTEGSGYYKLGTTVNISATMAKGYDWFMWESSNTDLVDNIMDMSAEVIVPLGGIVLTAVGAIKTFTITVIADEYSIVTPSDEEKTVEFGSDHIYSFSAVENHEIASVKVNGTDMGAIAKYRFRSVDNNYVIEVTSTKKKVAIVIQANVAGVNDTVKVEIGGSYSYVLPEKDGYNVHSVYVNGVETEVENGAIEFENLESDVNIEVIYDEIRNPSENPSEDTGNPGGPENPTQDNKETSTPEGKDDSTKTTLIIIAVVVGLLFVVTIVSVMKKMISRSDRW